MSRRILSSALAAVLLAGGAATAHGQAAPPPSSLDARDFVALGLAALELGEWELALRELRLAQIVRPLSRELFLLLGMACEGSGGRDVEAIAWFRAYLALEGSSPRASETRDRIVKLEKRIETLARTLLVNAGDLMKMAALDDRDLAFDFVSALAAAGALDEARKEADGLPAGGARAKARMLIVRDAAKRGDVATALKIAEDVGDEEHRDGALIDVVVAQAGRGDFSGARRTARRIRTAENQGAAYAAIVSAHHDKGDWVGLRETLAQVPPAARTRDFWWEVGFAHASSGDVQAARQAVAKIADAVTREFALSGVAATQARRGDYDGARQTIATIRDTGQRSSAWEEVITARAQRGDVAGARKLLATVSKNFAMSAGTYAALDDVGAALEMAERLHDTDRDTALYQIVEVRVRKGDVGGVRHLGARVKAPIIQRDAVLAVARALVATGDLKSAIAALADITDVELRREAEESIRTRPRIPPARPGSREEAAAVAWLTFVDDLYGNTRVVDFDAIRLPMSRAGAHADVRRALKRLDPQNPLETARRLVVASRQLMEALNEARDKTVELADQRIGKR
ncbi:MAG: hypothetical protein HY726_03185 [Candidatus Rokubacteria bacterium]|nr:hypothetical protein [Candidatus Rokubacteria bacterium]